MRAAINKNENKKLALKTNQATAVSPITTFGLAGTLQAFPMWGPSQLLASGIFSSGTDAKVAVRSMQQTILITNQSNAWVHLRIAKVKCRKLLTTLFSPLVFLTGVGAYPAINHPWGDFTTGTTFRRYFKILSNKRKIIRPGGIKTLHRKLFKPNGKMFSGQVEGNNAITAYPGMYVTYIMFVTMPYCERAPVDGITTDVGSIETTCAVVHEQKITYHLIEDRNPTSQAQSSAGIVNSAYTYNTGPTQLVANANLPEVDLLGPLETNSRQPRTMTLNVPK